MPYPNVIGLAKYTPEEIKRFDSMQRTLEEFNSKLGTAEELPMPSYTNDEMYDLSSYREMVIQKRFDDSSHA